MGIHQAKEMGITQTEWPVWKRPEGREERLLQWLEKGKQSWKWMGKNGLRIDGSSRREPGSS